MVGIFKLSNTEAKNTFQNMLNDLQIVRKAADEMFDAVEDMAPTDLEFDEGPLPEEESKKRPEIKTPEDAKKVLEEAVSDLGAVKESIDGICGEVEEEMDTYAAKRHSSSYGKALEDLSNRAQETIREASDAVQHWSFVIERRKKAKTSAEAQKQQIQSNNILEAIATLKEATELHKTAKEFLAVTGTAVPPTGADFSGDKWPNGKNPADVENRAWADGASKFHKDKSFEDARPNAAEDNRLNTVEYPRNEKPYVNASIVSNPNVAFSGYWDIFDTKTNKRIIASFKDAPKQLGPKTLEGHAKFASLEYGKKIVDNVIAAGIDAVAKQLNAKVASFEEVQTTIQQIAKTPEVKDKATIRRYYADAFGDAGYARELTSNKKTTANSSNKPQNQSKIEASGGSVKGRSDRQRTATDGKITHEMDTAYTPKDEHPKNKNNKPVKQGPGKISNQLSDEDKLLIKAKTEQGIALAQKCAAAGLIPFTKVAIKNKAIEIATYSDEKFATYAELIDTMPIKVKAALTTQLAHIPDTEVGITGNPSTGVRDPKSTIQSDGMDSRVKSDAKIASKPGFVPQFQTTASNRTTPQFSTVVSRIQASGGSKNQLRRPTYRRN